MTFAVIGINHITAPVAIRERFAIREQDVAEVAQAVVGNSDSEMIVLSTCNRVEFYVASAEISAICARAKAKLAEIGQTNEELVNRHSYTKDGDEAIAHLFNVAASLDSMVVGESQILGQLKSAVEIARQANTLGHKLEHLATRAFAVARKIRRETDIGRNAISISSVAVDLARQVFGDFKDRKVLLIGAGKMAELAAAQFSNTGAKLVVANRGAERADLLAEKFGAESHALSDLEDLFEVTDVVIASTGSRGYLFDSKTMERVIKRRKYRPIFFIDIAVPRNLDPDLNRIDGVYLYDLDALSAITQENVRKRSLEADHASAIVDEGLMRFKQESQVDATKPAIIAVRKSVHALAESEVDQLIKKLKLPEEDKTKLERLASNIANKILHGVIEEIKNSAGDVEPEKQVRAILRAFKVEDLDNE